MQVRIGVVGKAHGLRGEVAVWPTTDDPESRFVVGAEALVSGVPRRFASVRPHAGAWLVRFSGVGDRSGAEELRDADVVMETDLLPQLDADEFYDQELVGRNVFRHDGSAAGVIVGVQHLPAQDLLVVKTRSGTRLIPFVSDLVPVVERDFVRLADVGGLVDDVEEDV